MTKPQPLINKRTMLGSSIKTVGFYYRDIKSACEFYLRYEDNPELLLKEYPSYKKNIVKCGFKIKGKLVYLDETTAPEKYNEGLFKLAFKDVIGK